jgi:transcriptional regulator with XRE-family HTH domain
VVRKRQTDWRLRLNNRFVVDGKKLSEARIAANLSMEDVAAALGGCNKSSVSRWEQERLVPSEERIFKMVKLFKTDAFVIGNTAVKKSMIRDAVKTRARLSV